MNVTVVLLDGGQFEVENFRVSFIVKRVGFDSFQWAVIDDCWLHLIVINGIEFAAVCKAML